MAKASQVVIMEGEYYIIKYYQKMNFTSSRPPMERCWK